MDPVYDSGVRSIKPLGVDMTAHRPDAVEHRQVHSGRRRRSGEMQNLRESGRVARNELDLQATPGQGEVEQLYLGEGRAYTVHNLGSGARSVPPSHDLAKVLPLN